MLCFSGSDDVYICMGQSHPSPTLDNGKLFQFSMKEMCAHHSCKGFPACITAPALAEGPSESMAPTLGWPFFLDLSKAGEVEKSADREEGNTEQPISGL